MITDDNEKIQVDDIYYTLREVRFLIRSIKKGCPVECMPLHELQRIEHIRRDEISVANGFNDEQKRIDLKERTSDD